jgi:cell division initiation protein
MHTLTPLDIQQQKFDKKLRGYDVHAVDVFLDHTADALEGLLRENEKLKEDLRRRETEIQGYQSREESFKRALLNSQKVIEQMKENARKSAELLIGEAEVKAEKILSHAQNRLTKLHEDITELKRQRVQLEVQISSVIEAHSKLLDISRESTRATDVEDAKIKLLQQANK